MSLSQLARELKLSPTLAQNQKARLLKAQGEQVIHLGAGEPKTKAPAEAIEAAATLLKTAEIRYTSTSGTPDLVKAVIRYTEKNYNKQVGKEHIIVSSGAKQAFYNFMMAVLNPKDEVILLAPYWVSYPDIVEMNRGVPVVVTPADGGFIPGMTEIKTAVNDKTKAIVVNSPNNPSGAIYPPELIEALVTFCEEKDIYLVMDDIYHKLVFDGKKAVSCYDYAKVSMEDTKLVVLNGVSKAYAMTGFRIGWSVANPKLTEAMVKIAAQITTCPSGITQAAAVGALNGSQTGVEELRQILQSNCKVMLDELKTLKKVKITPPEGTFYCMPDFSAYSKDSGALSDLLLNKARVVTVPGVEFGMEGFLRLSVCGSVKDITDGIARIRWALDPESPEEIQIGSKTLRRDWL